MKKRNYICKDGECPQGIEALREIRLTSEEKQAIFLGIRDSIENQKEIREMVEETPLQKA